MESKRVLVISDLHCGHRAGLTPPGWQYNLNASDGENARFAELQNEIWKWFSEEVNGLGKIDILIANGDLIDGKGERSGAVEALEPDLFKQTDMAIEVIKSINADKVFITYGTGYHVGKGEDYELLIANEIGAEIRSHHFININKCIFDCKHKVGSSAIPHGRYTSLAREALWNELWSLNGNSQERADVLIRSHVHYFGYIGDGRKLAITTPALQGFGSKYGERECSGLVDIGFLHFDVLSKGDYAWDSHILCADILKAHVSRA